MGAILSRLLKPRAAIRQHQRVAYALLVRHGLDRRGLVHHALVIEQQRRPGLAHREADTGRAVRFEYARLAAAHADAVDKNHRDEVDAIAVRTLGRRPTDAFLGVDPELMRLD